MEETPTYAWCSYLEQKTSWAHSETTLIYADGTRIVEVGKNFGKQEDCGWSGP